MSIGENGKGYAKKEKAAMEKMISAAVKKAMKKVNKKKKGK